MTKNVGTIITLFISQEGTKGRVEKETLSLDEKGITSDKYYNKDIQRSILITSIQSYALAEEHH
ncbi:MAG TPA: MOSC domain-containing protein, partial [Epsilonproteobacteria bacterium]|nr:MOSC domain-containing protein [Campylobacterota bacterium]